MSLDLWRNTIHVWMTWLDDIEDAGLLRRFRLLLFPAELEQCDRFRFEPDRKRYLVTRALVRTVLSRYASIAPQNWVFINNAYGCPAIANEDIEARRINFNISHTSHLIMLGVAADRRIGVDIEHFRSRPSAVAIADRVFSPPEIADLRSLGAADQSERFFTYWTLKEAYIKARGQGLSIPLDGFSFSLSDDGGIHLTIDRRLNDDPARWDFWQFRPTHDYVAAICAERNSDRITDIIVRNVVPLTAEGAMNLPVIERKSR